MNLQFQIGGMELLPQYVRVPIDFQVNSELQLYLPENGLGGIELHEHPVAPYVKDYDALEGPLEWYKQFDMRNWGFILAYQGDEPVGAAAVAIDTPGSDMLAGRGDLSVLWDIRVAHAWRGKGVGKAVFDQSAEWSRQHGCTEMKIETQNINVAACRFYARQGCILGAIDRYGYYHDPRVRREVMLLWYLQL